MTAIRAWCQHHLNALNLYAAMCRWGVPCKVARWLTRLWARVGTKWLYVRGGDGKRTQ